MPLPSALHRLARMAATAALFAGGVACSGEGGDGAADPVIDGGVISEGVLDPPTAGEGVTALARPPGRPDPGFLSFSLGGEGPLALGIDECVLVPESIDEVTSIEFAVRAVGTRPDGSTLVVDARRFRTAGGRAAATFTDTITVSDLEGAAGLRAQRFETGGLVTDPRDPDATRPLLRVAGSEIVGSGYFGPTGSFAGASDLVEGAFHATCS